MLDWLTTRGFTVSDRTKPIRCRDHDPRVNAHLDTISNMNVMSNRTGLIRTLTPAVVRTITYPTNANLNQNRTRIRTLAQQIAMLPQQTVRDDSMLRRHEMICVICQENFNVGELVMC
jgi:hypothetical protein